MRKTKFDLPLFKALFLGTEIVHIRIGYVLGFSEEAFSVTVNDPF